MVLQKYVRRLLMSKSKKLKGTYIQNFCHSSTNLTWRKSYQEEEWETKKSLLFISKLS